MGHPRWCGPCQRGLFIINAPPPPRARGLGGYNHRDTGEEGEWRPPLLYANPLSRRFSATLFIARFMRNDMSGDHYEMTGKSSGCTNPALWGATENAKKNGAFFEYRHVGCPVLQAPLDGAPKLSDACGATQFLHIGLYYGRDLVNILAP